jgi:uncharacterized protein
METAFTPLAALIGGTLIGLSAVLLMTTHGRIAGMTGILAGILPPLPADWGWRVAFLAGAIGVPALAVAFGVAEIPVEVPASTLALVIGGAVVGIGITYGSGCTSGHGVCGIARLSPRSMVATGGFMLTAVATVFIIRHVIGG